ncbi:hypothetical protein V6N11_040590 [Hibiscus sabdariffa]|uniref:RNase H type-1 domain-containing protein n=1 Tax=Hibiscus sabdariffa TaxID=183260 RepID=A0ABR2RI40_9ROSI
MFPSSNMNPSDSIISRWTPALNGWFTLNTDGVVNVNSSFGSAGGLIPNSLLLAWSFGLERLQCQTDCVEAFKLITSSRAHSCNITLVRAIFRLISRAWVVDFCLIRQDVNSVTDSLAKIHSPSNASTSTFANTPPENFICLEIYLFLWVQ